MSERESVPEVCRFPGCGGVTRLAIYSSLAGVRILARMAGVTRFGRARKDTINVALSTGSVGVSAGQFESGKVMVKCGGLPGSSGVTGRAICAVLTAVTVILGMAGVTIFRRTSEYVIDMAIGTSRAAVLSGQREGGFTVIEGGGFPA